MTQIEFVASDCPGCGSVLKGPSHGVWEILSCGQCGHGVSVAAAAFQKAGGVANAYDDGAYIQMRTQQKEQQLKGVGEWLQWMESAGVKCKGQSILEVGCSTGEFLKVAKDAGYEVAGHDLAEQAVRLGREWYGINLSTDEKIFSAETYDIICAFNVLEHVAEPESFIAAVTRNLAPGGALYLIVPHWRSASARLFGENWPGFCAEHIEFFSDASVRGFLGKLGFDVEKISTIDVGRYMLGGVRRMLNGKANPFGANESNRDQPVLSQKALRMAQVFNMAYKPLGLIERMTGLGDEMRSWRGSGHKIFNPQLSASSESSRN